jgi:HJR/Mrr/RecB family endonuclease
LQQFARSTSEKRSRTGIDVVVEEADVLTEEEIRDMIRAIRNYKAVRSLMIITESEIQMRGVRTLRLEGLSASDAQTLISSQLGDVSPESMAKLIEVTRRNPVSIRLVTQMARSMSDEQLTRVLRGELYELEKPSGNLVALAKPKVIAVNEAMVKALKKRPEDILKLHPRKYEELIAELLDDLGYDVQLTKATRDGGKDILAYFKTEIGTYLTLVEAKRFGAHNKVGVELVRALYGTLADHSANSAMLVTTSSFSEDARVFQRRHPYELSLKDYTDVAGWIQKYGQK